MQKYSLAECHGHIALDGKNYKNSMLLHSESISVESIRNTLKQYKDNNITFFRDGGDKWNVSMKAKEIAPEYDIDFRTPVYAIHKKGFYGNILGFSYETINDYLDLVKDVHQKNGDFIKIMLSGIMDFNNYGVVSPCDIAQSEIKELVHIAHESGFKVMAHVNGDENIKKAIEAGVDSIEHGYYMDVECIKMLSDTKIVWIPTLAPLKNICDTNLFNNEIINKILEKQYENLQYASALNVNIGPGSDSGSYMVSHVKGIISEEKYILEVLGNTKKTKDMLANSMHILKNVFKRN